MADLNKNERIDYFYNDDLQIIQDKTAFSFSTDTLLLAAWATQAIRDRHKVVELCAGNCVASMYMAYFNKASYDAVEIQSSVADQAQRSINLNHLENRITLHIKDAKQATTFLRKDSYDEVVVNPPYFKAPAGHQVNPDRKKAIARHEILINLAEIMSISSQLLKMKGKLFMVHRPERLAEICQLAAQNDLSVKWVQPFVAHRGEHANLIIVQLVKHTGSDGLVLADTIAMQDATGQYLPAVAQYLFESKAAKAKRLARPNYYFYVLLCHDQTFYGGFTTDLAHRLAAHNAGKGAKYTKARRPVTMIYHECFSDKRDALKREYWFKHHTRSWKEAFLRAKQVKF
ncbi:MAG: GIY-YIG nuclease family protein [Lactobacillus sp.]